MGYRLAHIEMSTHGIQYHYANVIDWKTKGWNGTTHFVESALEKPFHWKKSMIFVCSMGDLFHESIPFEMINSVFTIMSDCDWHIYQILTKRPKRVLDFFTWKWLEIKKNTGQDIPWFPKDNIWFGVTVENQENINRIADLIKIPVKIHFISAEPLLSEIFIPDLQNINWIISGEETGHKYRPMKIEWIESLYEQCKAANVPFFDKKNILGLNIQQFPI
jgi:protein gp37